MTNQAIQDILSRSLEIPESVDARIEETLLRIKTDDLTANSKKDKSYKKPIYRKPAALAAAVAIMLLMFSTIALAYSESFRAFVFGNSSARLVEFSHEYVTEFDDGSIIVSANTGGIVNRSVPDVLYSEDITLVEGFLSEKFLSFEELQQAALFTVTEPSHLPEHLAFKQAEIVLFEDGTYSYDVFATYKCTESHKILYFFQLYAGPDAYLDIHIIDRIELDDYRSKTQLDLVMVGNTEALLSVTIDDAQSKYITLSWIQNDVAYNLSSIDFDIETLIAIANSI